MGDQLTYITQAEWASQLCLSQGPRIYPHFVPLVYQSCLRLAPSSARPHQASAKGTCCFRLVCCKLSQIPPWAATLWQVYLSANQRLTEVIFSNVSDSFYFTPCFKACFSYSFINCQSYTCTCFVFYWVSSLNWQQLKLTISNIWPPVEPLKKLTFNNSD